MNWLHTVWFGYAVPSLYGNGPEALIEIAILAVLGRLAWPFIKREIHSGEALIHRKIDHVIHHSEDIPEFKDPAQS